jgi:hypothetical protein
MGTSHPLEDPVGSAAPRGQTENSRHIAWLTTSFESLCDATPMIKGVVTHNNEKDQLLAYLRNISEAGEQETRG